MGSFLYAGLNDRAQHVTNTADECGQAVKTFSVLVVGQMPHICPVGQVKSTDGWVAVLACPV